MAAELQVIVKLKFSFKKNSLWMDCSASVDWFLGVVDELFGTLRVVYESNFGIALRI